MVLNLHIVSFDVPWPADYGGVIDVFYKIKWLKQLGVNVTLHCFAYGRQPAHELEAICKKVHYYERKTSPFKQLSSLPYNVSSRYSPELVNELRSDNAPILLEVLHTCWLMNEPTLKGRTFIYRHSNIEHEYYRLLAASERNWLKKQYLLIEARRLEKFESVISHAKFILAVNQKDTAYFKKKFPQQETLYLPSFHPNDQCISKTGLGKYVLFHGNLSISENYHAASWLIENVFSKMEHPVIIAGKNPPLFLKNTIEKYHNIQLIGNPSDQQMNDLIENAHVHCLYTHQATGLKLKLLNVLYRGRYILLNPLMAEGTGLLASDSLFFVEQPIAFLDKINDCMLQPFTPEQAANRTTTCQAFSNEGQAATLLHLIERFDSPS